MPEHQVFISYNSRDADLALPVVAVLKAQGISLWLDQEQLLPGRPWLPVLEAGLTACGAVAVLIGPNGLGPVQQTEMAAALDQARRDGKPVIPVLLKDAADMPPFLAQYGYVDLADGPAGPGLDRLILGITADRPETTPARPAPKEHLLTVRRDGDALSADWDHGNPFPLELPLTKGDLDELAWYLERYIEFPGAGDHARARALEQHLTDWGLALWQALFPGGEQNACYTGIRDHLDRGGRVLLTLAGDSPAFLIRPWEMLRDTRGPLALRGLTLRRRLMQQNAPATFQLGLPLRLLLIVSRPEDTGFIDSRTSTRPVLDALAGLGDRVAIAFCEPPTLIELERRLAAARRAGRPYHIVHFDGHGQYYPETGVGALCFERDDRKTALIAGRRLGDLLSRLQVPLVLLEACRGAQVSDRPVFGAVAPALLQSGVGSVIAFSHSVHIAAASLLCERLYRELAAGASIGEALEEARAALLANRARWLTPGPDPETVDLQDWIIPQLYQGGGDPVLIPAGSTIQSDRHDDPVDEVRLPGFPPAPRYRFHGRARELLTLERALQRHPAVLLHAGGGMGKTALAREAAHWWRRTGRFDHALFHSFEQGAGAEAVVRLIGETQEGEQGGDGFVALGPDAQWTEAVRLFRRTQLLLVWDNFESVGAAFGAPMGAPIGAPIGAPASGRPVDETSALLVDLQHLYRDLTEGTPTGRLLVTCRPAETGLDGIAEVPLAGLARPDALHLLRSAVERKAIDLERPGYERSAIDALLDRLADHPLSIELIAPHLKALTPKTIGAELAERLDQFEDRSHAEGRNRSLLASLDFSHRRLSPAARAALPWLGWFEGGMFERFFLDFAEIPEQEWAGIRAELTTTALLRVEDLPDFNPPYLKLHPTLAEAAAPDGTDSERARRFIDVYLAVGQQIAGALRGAEPAAGMALMRREQANLRQAMALAFDAARHRVGAMLAETLRNYLERAGRLRERDRLTALVRVRMPEDRLDGAGCAAIRQYAWSLLTQGLAQQALDAVQDLERRLDAGELRDGDPATQLALTRTYRGRILDHAGRPDLGIEPLEQAVAGLRGLGDDRRGNLSIALGDLTNALRHLGRYDRALAVADEALEIDRALGRDREVAAGLGRTAEILMDAGRHAEAEARYGEALETAERVGDLGLQGLFLQHLGSLQRKTDRTAESVDTLRRAFRLFQQSGDRGSEMRTSDLLGSAEMLLGRPDPAEAWYRKALDLASDLGDQHQIGITRQNLGILRQTRAEAAVDAAECDRLLAAAVTEIEASLDVWQEMHNQLNTAASHGQLSILHRLRGDPDRAETEARQALAIYEPLNNPNTWKVYANLADIARARGDETAAADWQAKADVKRAELDRLAAGPETGGDPGAAAPDRQLIEMLIALTQAVHDARGHHRAPEPDVAEALAQLAGLPAPYGPFGCFLEAIARGEDATAPPDLPEPLDKIAGDLLDALRT